ncbi:MAG TPA: M20/M25/M40 family metallo-hydrolase [Candidatus Limnocylindrales bacterium]|nr:M20/M25/M40 family metallo-hydrolase [Candidatus Limnocylindrales bacterium]
MTPDEDVLDLVGRLVAIDSVNPSLVPGAAGESRVAAFVADWARSAGLGVDVVEETPGRPSVIVRGGGRTGGGRTLLLCAHLDTVGLDAVADPLTVRADGDRLYGRGVYDMKGGLAAALVACRDAVAAGIAGQIVVACVADEEHASLGIQEVLRHVTADAAIVTEPTELAIATAHKGFVWTEIAIAGRAAHGSRPHLGVDAILKAGPILVGLEALNRRLADRPHPALGPGILHGSLIAGGIGESTIPDRCVITVERRTLPGESVADVEAEIEAVLGACRSADPELVVTQRTTLARSAFETDPNTPIAEALRAATGSVLGTAAPTTAVSYWADSAFIAEAGIPTVLFGPIGDGAHAEVEWVSASSTVATARALTAAAIAFCA